MNRSNSMSRSLHVFFVDLVTGEIWFVESHKLQFWFYSLFHSQI
ncbi:unnamed protein product [Brassica rapa subsp. trilocularis]